MVFLFLVRFISRASAVRCQGLFIYLTANLNTHFSVIILILHRKNMGRILAIDYGQKRVGLAVTDELRMIATGLETVHVKDIWAFLENYMQTEQVDTIVIGEPRDMKNQPSDASRFIEPFVNRLKKIYKNKNIERFDERFTSRMAHDAMLSGGLKKKKRQDKALVDTISATLILQSYMQSITLTR